MNPLQMQAMAHVIAAQNRKTTATGGTQDGQQFLETETVTIRITNASATTKHSVTVFDPGNFYGLNTGTSNSSDITIEGTDKKHKIIERRMLSENWVFAGVQLKVDEGKEKQFGNNIKVFLDNPFNDESNFIHSIKPSPYKTSNQYQSNIADIQKVFTIGATSALVMKVEPDTYVDLIMYVIKRTSSTGV